jgi:hypothetical protein
MRAISKQQDRRCPLLLCQKRLYISLPPSRVRRLLPSVPHCLGVSFVRATRLTARNQEVKPTDFTHRCLVICASFSGATSSFAVQILEASSCWAAQIEKRLRRFCERLIRFYFRAHFEIICFPLPGAAIWSLVAPLPGNADQQVAIKLRRVGSKHSRLS